MVAEGLELSARADFDRKDALRDDSTTIFRLYTNRFDLRSTYGSDSG